MVGKFESTYLLVAHGSRDPRPQEALEKLAKLLAESLARLGSSSVTTLSPLLDKKEGVELQKPVVATATLEFGLMPLHQQICEFGEYTGSLGLSKMQVVPLFLLPGVHVKEDLPSEVAAAQEVLKGSIIIDLRSHLGSDAWGLEKWVTTRIKSVAIQTNKQNNFIQNWILLSHGSRRPGGNSTTEEMAKKVGALMAYWSVPPSLEEQVKSLVEKGTRQIGILPYFLFRGGITDAIAETVEQLQQQFPSVEFHLASPLEASVELVDLLVDLIQK